MGFYGNPSGGFGMPKTIILTDDNGDEITGVVVDSQVIFTATDNDVREGLVYASDGGVSTGTKDIPSYHTITGVQAIPADTEFKISIQDGDMYDYTELQAMIMPYDSDIGTSMAVNRVVIKDSVYNTGSNEIISSVTKDSENKTISLGIVNGDTPAIIRYFAYKEEF